MRNMQTLKGSISVFALMFAASFLLLLPGCQGPVDPQADRTGTVSLTIGQLDTSRAIQPNIPTLDSFDSVTAVFSRDGHPNHPVTLNDDFEGQATLAVGEWTLTVEALIGGVVVAEPSAPVVIDFGVDTDVQVTLLPVAVGQGTFTWALTVPDNTSGTLEIRTVNADGNIVPTPIMPAITFAAAPSPWVGGEDLAAGTYFVRFRLEHGTYGVAVLTKDLHVYHGMTSHFERTFTSYQFRDVDADCDCGVCEECVERFLARLPGDPGDLDDVRADAAVDGPGSIVWNMQAHTAEALLPRFATTPNVTNFGTVFTSTVDGQVIAFVTNFIGDDANDPNGRNWAPIVILPIGAAGVEVGDVLRVEGRFGMPTHPWQGGDGRLRRGFGTGHELAQALTIASGPFSITYTITQGDIDRGLTIGFNSWQEFGPAMVAGTNHFIIGIDDMVILRGDPQDCAECGQYPCICCTHCNTFPCTCVGIAFNMADGAFQELAPGAFTQGNTPAGGFNIGDGNTTMTVIAYEGRNFLRLSGMSVNHNGLNLPTEGVRAGDTIRIMGRIGAVGADVRLLIDWSLWPPRDPASPTILTPGTEFTITHTIPWGAATFGDLRLTANNAAGDFYIYSVIIGRGLADPSLAAEIEAAENWRPSAEPCDCPTCTNCDCRGDDASCEVGCTCTPPDQDWARVLAALEYTGHDGTNEQSVTVNATDDGIVITTTSRWHGLRMFLSHLQGYILDTTPPTGDNFRVMRFTIEYNTAHGAVTEADVSATTDRPESGVVTFITNANNAAVRFLQNPGADRDPAGSTFTITKMEIATVAGWRDDDTIASLTCIFDVLP